MGRRLPKTAALSIVAGLALSGSVSAAEVRRRSGMPARIFPCFLRPGPTLGSGAAKLLRAI